MKKYKIFKVGNYLKAISVTTGEIFTAPIKNVEVQANNVGNPSYKIINLKSNEFKNSLAIGQILNEAGTPYTQEDWVTFYTENTSGFNGGGTAPTTFVSNSEMLAIVSSELGDQVFNTTYNSYYYYNGTEWSIIGSNTPITSDEITVVDNYSLLPAPIDASQDFYWVSNSQGTSWLPGSLGGSYYPKGLYFSNGVSWEYLETPYQATQLEVNAGTNDTKFLTPKTFKNADTTITVEIDTTFTNYFYTPNNIKINSTTNINGNPTVSIKVNNTPYTLGTSILQGSLVTVTSNSIVGVVNLNIRYE